MTEFSSSEIDIAHDVMRMVDPECRQYHAKFRLWGVSRWVELPCKDILEAINKVMTRRIRVVSSKYVGSSVNEFGIKMEQHEVTVDLAGQLVTKVIEADNVYQVLYNVTGKDLVIEEIRECDCDLSDAIEAQDETSGPQEG